MDLKSKLEEVSILIQRLDRAFNAYFTGFERKPPQKLYLDLQREVKKLHDLADGLKRTADRHLLQMVVSRFSSYRIKWDRGLRAIEEGTMKPGTGFFGGTGRAPRTGEEVDFDAIAAKGERGEQIDDRLDAAAQRYVTLARAHTGKVYDPEAVKKMLASKLPEVRQKHGDAVDFEVYFDGKKVRVKPVPTKK